MIVLTKCIFIRSPACVCVYVQTTFPFNKKDKKVGNIYHTYYRITIMITFTGLQSCVEKGIGKRIGLNRLYFFSVLKSKQFENVFYDSVIEWFIV